MSEITGLTAQERVTLNQFRNAVSDILEPKHDDEFLLRWLTARDFDVSKAEKMIRKSYKFRHNLEATDILNDFQPPEVLKKYLYTKFWGFDEEGSPVRYAHMGKVDWKGIHKSSTPVDFLKNVFCLIESDQKRAKEYADQTGKKNLEAVLVLDYKGMSIRTVLDRLIIKYSLMFAPTYPDNFPELLKVAYLINAPSYFCAAFNMVKPFMAEKTLKKLRFFSDGGETEILKHINPKIVPKFYGGELNDPNFDPNNFTNLEVPSEFFLDDELHIKLDDPRTIQIFIRERSFFEHKINVEEPGTQLKWVFQTKDFNIKYGMYFQVIEDFPNKPTLKELVKAQFVDSYIAPERGELICEEAGVYILHFDNTHSWMTKKEVRLQIHIDKPE